MTSSALVMRVFTKNNRILRSKQTREQWLSQLRLRRRLKSFVVPSIVIKHLWTTASEFVNEMLIFRSSRSQMFFKISVLKNSQYWSLFLIIKLQTFFYGTPTVAASEFLWQQVLFCSWICYLLLKVAPVFVLDSFENTS